MTNKYNLPESFEEQRQPFLIPSQYKKIGLLADVHIPYHSLKNNEIAIDALIKYNVDCVIINGDLLDFYQLSKFQKDPRKRSVADELEATRQYLDVLAQYIGKRIFYKLGNHDERYEKYLMTKAPELLGISEFRLDILLKLGEKKIEYITDKRKIMAGGLTILHGHELNMKSVIVNPARSLFLKAKVSSLCSHLHIPSHHPGKRIDGHIIGCWSTGHLGDESPHYAPYNEWMPGFAIIDVDGKEFEVSNFKNVNNKAYRT